MLVWIIIVGLHAFAKCSEDFDFDFGLKDGLAIVKQVDDGENKKLENGMPESIDIEIDLLTDNVGPFLMHMELNQEDLDAKPIYTIEDSNEHKRDPVVKKSLIPIEQNVGLYQCDETNAAFTITCKGLEYGICKPVFLGSININGTDFDIKPSDEVVATGTDKDTVYSVHSRKPQGKGKTCATGKSKESLALSNSLQSEAKNAEFKLFAMRNRFRYIHNAGPSSYGQFNELGSDYTGNTNGAANTYSVGMLIVIDDVIFNRFYAKARGYTRYERIENAKTQIRQYYAHTVNAMDIRYKNIRHHAYEIRIVVTGYLIDDNYMIDVWNGPREAAVEDAMYKAINWRKMMISELPPHDHLMIFTGRNLYTKATNDYSVTGFASLDSICRHDSVSIIEDKGGLDCIITATHELGHSLGARHDGDRNLCTPLDKYIMTSIGGDVTHNTRLNPFKFSECSRGYFLDKIQTLNSQGRNCLSVQKIYYDPREFAALNSVSTGQLFDANQQCKMKLGEGSYYGWGGNLGSFRDICTHMACKSNKTATSFNLYNAARGTSCGNKMWCMDGECVYDQQAPARDEQCVHGDSLRSFAAYHSCTHMITSDPSRCLDPYYRQFCCESCKQYGSNSFILTDGPNHSAKMMSIPTTHHINRAHTNTMSAAPGFGIEGGLGYHDFPLQNNEYSAPSATRNNIKRQLFDQSPTSYESNNNNNKFRVISMHPRGESTYGRNNQLYTNQQSNNRNPYYTDPNYEHFAAKNSDNSISLPDHQKANMAQTQLSVANMNSDELTSFRNLVMRTLQLLARTTNELMKHSPSPVAPPQARNDNNPPRSEYLGPDTGYYGMREASRTVEEKRVGSNNSLSNESTDSVNATLSSTGNNTVNMTELPQSFMNELEIFGMNIGEPIADTATANPADNIILPVLPAAALNTKPSSEPNSKAQSNAWHNSIKNVIDPFFK